MKTNKLIEAVENVNTFNEMFDLTEVVYESKSHDFGFVRVENGWSCEVNKVTKVADGKDTKYNYKLVFKMTSSNMIEAFKLAALKLLKGMK